MSRPHSALLVATPLVVGALLLARDVAAAGPLAVEIALKAGFGSNPAPHGTPNPLGASLGGRVGVSFFGFYAGASLVDYLGQSESAMTTPPGASVPVTSSISYSSLLYGVEAGYGVTIFDRLTLRPQIGLGSYSLSDSYLGQHERESHIYVEPGVTALVSLGRVFVGADISYLVVPGVTNYAASVTWTAVTFHAQLGIKF